MVLINEPASFPANMWAVVRYLADARRPVPQETARALLCPPPLRSPEAGRPDPTFDNAVRSLTELGLVQAADGQLILGPSLAQADPDDLDGFLDQLRRAVLDPDRNSGLGTSDSQVGPRDLVRALAWFLAQDPLDPPMGMDEIAQRQRDAFADDVGRALVNDVRWNRFTYWAPALGFAADNLIPSTRTKLVPDCTEAVRRCLLSRFADRQTRDLGDVLEAIWADLPVLPGGRYSRELGLPVADVLAPSLSFALLRGVEAAWWRLEDPADAPRTVLLTDPSRADGVRRFSGITVWGPHDD
ncbi:MAG TPA: protein DpdG [Pseudonocardiaceae bacterium]